MVLDIIDHEQVFYGEFEYFCYKVCYYNILRYYGVRNPELYLNYTMKWILKVDNNSTWGFSFSFGDSNDGLKRIFDNSIIEIDNEFEDEAKIWEINKNWLELGMPVVVGVDVYYLPYTPYYERKHAIHSLIVCGYKENEVEVIDWYPDWFYKGKIDLEDLDYARKSKNDEEGILSGVPIQYESIVIKKDIYSDDHIGLIKKTINDLKNEFYCKGNNDLFNFYGYSALCEFGKILENNEGMKDDERKLFLKYVFESVYFVPSRKRMFLWFMNSVSNIYPSFQSGQLIEKIKKSIDEWKKFISILTKCMISGKMTDYEKILIKFKEILDDEKDLYYEIYKFDGCLGIITRRTEL